MLFGKLSCSVEDWCHFSVLLNWPNISYLPYVCWHLIVSRYVLSNNFEDWTPEAREKVMEGVDVLLELLVSMHVSRNSHVLLKKGTNFITSHIQEIIFFPISFFFGSLQLLHVHQIHKKISHNINKYPSKYIKIHQTIIATTDKKRKEC